MRALSRDPSKLVVAGVDVARAGMLESGMSEELADAVLQLVVAGSEGSEAHS